MAGRPMTTADKPPLEIHAFEQDGFQAARLGLGDERAVGDSGPGRRRLAWREIEDDETFFRVAGDIQFGVERYGFPLLPGDHKLEKDVARHLRGRACLGSRLQLGVRVAGNLVESIGVLAVVTREHELHLGNDDAIVAPFQSELTGNRVAQVPRLSLPLGIVKAALKIRAFKNASCAAAGFAAWS